MTMTTMKKAVAGVLVAAALVAMPGTSWAAGDAVSRVAAHSTQTWTVFVSAGWHRVGVNGDHDTDLDLYVSDIYGNLLGKDDDSTDTCLVDFYVPVGQYVRISVQNLGSVYNQYAIGLR